MAGIEHSLNRKGWFSLPDRPGDRRLEDQLKGLERLLSSVRGRTVLDVGCAEGLIAIECARAGAAEVCGIEIVEDHLHVARTLAPPDRCHFKVGNAETFEPDAVRDITLMLAVLHKLRAPLVAAKRFARATSEMCVVRLPRKAAPCIFNRRSGWRKQNVQQALAEEGFVLDSVTTGHDAEWCGYFVRRSG